MARAYSSGQRTVLPREPLLDRGVPREEQHRVPARATQCMLISKSHNHAVAPPPPVTPATPWPAPDSRDVAEPSAGNASVQAAQAQSANHIDGAGPGALDGLHLHADLYDLHGVRGRHLRQRRRHAAREAGVSHDAARGGSGGAWRRGWRRERVHVPGRSRHPRPRGSGAAWTGLHSRPRVSAQRRHGTTHARPGDASVTMCHVACAHQWRCSTPATTMSQLRRAPHAASHSRPA